MIGFVILCTAVLAIAAVLVSGMLGLILFYGERWMHRLAPSAQARILLGAAVAPPVVMLAVLTGWMADIYVFGCHAHRCIYEHVAPMPGLLGLLIGGALLMRVGFASGRAATSAWRSLRTRRLLDAVSTPGRAGTKLIPVDEPQAFVIGIVRPQVYVSRGLLAAAGEGDLRSVLAHEEAHAGRRDPLRRLVASLALSFHLPSVAVSLERHLARAHEMAADAAAARVIGDGPSVAEVLVRFARLRVSPPAISTAVAWFGGDLEARVRDLLSDGHRPDRPRAAWLVAGAVGLLVIALLAADPIHSGAEVLLAALDR